MKKLFESQFRILSGFGSDLTKGILGPQHALSGMFGSDPTKGMLGPQHALSGMFGSDLTKGVFASQHALLASDLTKGVFASQHALLASDLTKGVFASQHALFASDLVKGMLASQHVLLASDMTKGLFASSHSIFGNVSSKIAAEMLPSRALMGIFGTDVLEGLFGKSSSFLGGLFDARSLSSSDSWVGLVANLPAVRTFDALFQSARLQHSLAPASPLAELLRNLSSSFEQDEQGIFFDFFDRFISDLAEQVETGPVDPVLRLEHLERLREIWAFVLSYLAPILMILATIPILASHPGPVLIEGQAEQQSSRQALENSDIAAKFEQNSNAQQRLLESVQRVSDNFRQVYEEACFDKSRIREEGLPALCYVVSRSTKLYSKPFVRSTPTAVLYPNETVKLIERKGRWIKIEYYDLVAGEVRDGWVQKKYLGGTPME